MRLATIVIAMLMATTLSTPEVDAGGTRPSTTGSYILIDWYQFYEGTEISGHVKIAKLYDDGSPTYDWLNIVNYMRQKDGNNLFDYPRFTTYVGQEPGYPNEVDWEPGVRSPTFAKTTFSITANGPSASIESAWDHKWNVEWEIKEQGTFDGSFQYRYHVERAEHKGCWSCGGGRQYDWDYLHHGTTWRIAQRESTSIWYGSRISFCESSWCGTSGVESTGLGNSYIEGGAASGDCYSMNQPGLDNCSNYMLSKVPPPLTPGFLADEEDFLDSCGEVIYPDCDYDTPDTAEYALQQELNNLL